MKEIKEIKKETTLGGGWALLPLVALVGMLVGVIRTFGSDALGGASQVTLLIAAGLCVAIGMWKGRVRWEAFETAITQHISSVAPAILILLLIGALSGAWMVSGVVPSLIYYGVKIIRPEVFLASGCIICSLVSVMTGSSWTTIATIGIALMGIGRAQGFDDGWIAGAIISGAYFGDKVSPLSDTTVLASGSVGVPLFRHIRFLLQTTVPSMAITLILFAVAGLAADTADTHTIAKFSAALSERFELTPWLLIVPLATGVLIWKKVPPVVTLFLSTALAIVFAAVFQAEAVATIGEGNLVKGLMQTVMGETALPTESEMLSGLVATRGMGGMMGTIWLILCAMCFGGAMEAGGMIRGITALIMRGVRGRTSLVGVNVVNGLLLNVAIADQYLCILLNNRMFVDVYKDRGLDPRLLSRTTEDSVTVTSVLVPWNTCGMTQSTVLGVATWTYLPYCFFNLLSPVMSYVVVAVGRKAAMVFSSR